MLNAFTVITDRRCCSSFGFCSRSVVSVGYLCCDEQDVVRREALHAWLHRGFKRERSTGSSHLTGVVNVAELVELDLILWQVVISKDKQKNQNFITMTTWQQNQKSCKMCKRSPKKYIHKIYIKGPKVKLVQNSE